MAKAKQVAQQKVKKLPKDTTMAQDLHELAVVAQSAVALVNSLKGGFIGPNFALRYGPFKALADDLEDTSLDLKQHSASFTEKWGCPCPHP